MSNPIVLRTARDRLRYAILFELLLVGLLATLGTLVLNRHIVDVGLLAALLSVKAMLLNVVYNWLFDKMDVRARRVPTERSWQWRAVHAIGFESVLIITSLPIVTWWLGLTILQALAMEAVVMSVVVAYTFLFGWGYDRVFPVMQPNGIGNT